MGNRPEEFDRFLASDGKAKRKEAFDENKAKLQYLPDFDVLSSLAKICDYNGKILRLGCLPIDVRTIHASQSKVERVCGVTAWSLSQALTGSKHQRQLLPTPRILQSRTSSCAKRKPTCDAKCWWSPLALARCRKCWAATPQRGCIASSSWSRGPMAPPGA